MESYFAQAIPEPRQCLGLSLRPLSLGHVLLLHRLESVFVGEGKPDADLFQELAVAVAICAQSYTDALDMLRDPKTPYAMALWAQKLTRTRWIDSLLLSKPKPIDLEAELSAFGQYVKESSEVPHYTYNPANATEMDCPFVQLVRATLQRELGISDEAILDRSWQQCLWDYVTIKALDGHVKMMRKETVADALEVGKRIAEALAKKGVKVNGAS